MIALYWGSTGLKSPWTGQNPSSSGLRGGVRFAAILSLFESADKLGRHFLKPRETIKGEEKKREALAQDCFS